MKSLDLYKFVTKNELEYHWNITSSPFEGNETSDVILFIPIDLLSEWNLLLDHYIFDEDGLQCIIKDKYMYFMMQEICDYFNIEITEIFGEDGDN